MTVKRSAKRRWMIAAGALCVAATSAFALRQAPLFRVARVEISGSRLLAPHEVLTASGVDAETNVWGDPTVWESALAEHPVIGAATVERRFPRTLRIRIREERPIVLVQAGALRMATAAGELLPLDPAQTLVDLPLLRADGDVGGSPSVQDRRIRGLLAEIGRLDALDPTLLGRLSELREDRDGLLLSVSSPRAEVRLPRGVDRVRLAELRAALDELGRLLPGELPADAAPVRLDLRFKDQIVIYSLTRA